MKLLYDHQIYSFQNYGGISRYFYELSKGLKLDLKVDVANSVLLSSNVYTTDPLYQSQNILPNVSFKGKGWIFKNVNQLNSLLLINKQNFDIFHPTYFDTYFFNILKNKPFVITFYDLINEQLKDRFTELNIDNSLF